MVHDLGELDAAVVLPQEVPDRDRADEAVLRVHDVDLVDVGFVFAFGDGVEGLEDGLGAVHLDQVGGHDAARGVLGVGHQPADVLGLLLVHLLDDLGADRLVQFAEDVRGVVGLHLLEEVGDFAGGHGLGDLGGDFGVEFGEDVGLQRFGEDFEQGLDDVPVVVADELGDVGRLEAGDFGRGLAPELLVDERGDAVGEFFHAVVKHGCLRGF